ncbi:MAG: ABC transporter permease [Reyranellaceae bacterium]
MSAQVDSAAAGAPLLRRKRTRLPFLVLCAIVCLAAVVLVTAFAQWLQPQPYTEQDLFQQLDPPLLYGGTTKHVLGTDDLGRDVLSRLLVGTQVSVLIAMTGTAIGAVLGVLIGMLAAHLRGWFDEATMMLVDAQTALPFIVFALAILAFFGGSVWLLVLIIGINGWERYARLTRGLVFGMQSSELMTALRSLGFATPRIYWRHILPNIAGVLVIQFTVNLPAAILLETSLSFLGIGIQPPMTSLGQMLGQGRDYLVSGWWVAVMPGMMIFLITVSISILGDWLRDYLDPTLK